MAFRPNEEGVQQNDCRDGLLEYARGPTEARGRAVAARLQRVTTNRSGLGLLFLLKGEDGRAHHNLVISRFPADEGIVARENEKSLSVEFIERVFMRNARAYKSALYRTSSLAAGFWDGMAVDRQISGPRDLSQYWIGDFLESELRTTGPAGTRRLAVALRSAVAKAPALEVKQELISLAQLLPAQDGRTTSGRAILRRLGASERAVEVLEREFHRPELLTERFRFDAGEFRKHALYRTVELDNGAFLTAESSRFSEVFQVEALRSEPSVRYTTEGAVVDERLRKTR